MFSIIIVEFLLWVEKWITKFSREVICFCECKTAKVLVIARDQWYSVWGCLQFLLHLLNVCYVWVSFIWEWGGENLSIHQTCDLCERVCACMCDEMSVSSRLCKHCGALMRWGAINNLCLLLFESTNCLSAGHTVCQLPSNAKWRNPQRDGHSRQTSGGHLPSHQGCSLWRSFGCHGIRSRVTMPWS